MDRQGREREVAKRSSPRRRRLLDSFPLQRKVRPAQYTVLYYSPHIHPEGTLGRTVSRKVGGPSGSLSLIHPNSLASCCTTLLYNSLLFPCPSASISLNGVQYFLPCSLITFTCQWRYYSSTGAYSCRYTSYLYFQTMLKRTLMFISIRFRNSDLSLSKFLVLSLHSLKYKSWTLSNRARRMKSH